MPTSSYGFTCLDCSTSIPFEPKDLLSGTKVLCPNCMLKLSIARDAKSIVEETLAKLEELKKKQ
ncbi:MAG: hypothetical protein H6579_07915 [Chitinophagales bacterium]|nr:hypothetical protein [Chitinophagales bacterium]